MRYFFLLLTASVFYACNPMGSDGTTTNDSTKTETATATTEDGISEVRNNPQSAPVANYQEKVQNDLNDWYFRVGLYETKDRFVYRMAMEYEAIKEEKDIRLPNLKMEPKPQIKKGAKQHEAIVGFLDEKGDFREYLKVFVQDGNLQIKTLKHYAVYEKKVE